jgi:uncharacterized protein
VQDGKRPLVLYHGPDCADGWTAAWVAHRVLGDGADYLPVQYGQPPPDATGRPLYVLDFSYKRPEMKKLLAEAAFGVVLDHHKTAEAELAGLDVPYPGRLVFDMGKSGARLAWEHFFPGQPAPWLVEYTEDRDLWAWKLPFSREVSAGLAARPRTFAEWDELGRHPHRPPGLTHEGAAILRYQSQLVDSACAHAREVDIDGHKVLAVNATCLISETAGRLAEGRPFGACWFVRGDGKRVWSLRSHDGGVDVSEVARRHGGGGHFHAAGYEEGVP